MEINLISKLEDKEELEGQEKEGLSRKIFWSVLEDSKMRSSKKIDIAEQCCDQMFFLPGFFQKQICESEVCQKWDAESA